MGWFGLSDLDPFQATFLLGRLRKVVKANIKWAACEIEVKTVNCQKTGVVMRA